MTLEAFFLSLIEYRTAILVAIFLAPWLAWLICTLIPGQREEPFVLSVNLGLAVTCLLMWAGYLAYATNTGGWEKVVTEADFLLLLAPLYYVAASLWMSSKRLPLANIPAFRALQGLAMMAGVFLMFSWLAQRIRIIFFSYIPFSTFLVLLAILLGIGYLGYLRLLGKNP